MRRYRAPRLRVRVDGAAPIEGALVVAANTSTYAGVMSVADRARPDSGHFDVVVLPRGNVASLMRYAWMSWRRRISRLDGVAYVTGGNDNDANPLNSVEMFVAATGTWATAAPMGMARANHAAAVLGGFLYVTGGRDANFNPLATAEGFGIE